MGSNRERPTISDVGRPTKVHGLIIAAAMAGLLMGLLIMRLLRR